MTVTRDHVVGLSPSSLSVPGRRRKSHHSTAPTTPSSQLKFRPSGTNESQHGRGTRPLPEPMAVADFVQMIVIHGCKKILLLDQRAKCVFYLAATFVLSILADAFHFPRTYFSNPRNGLNSLFVGFGWGWTLVIVAAFITCTGLVHHCGDRRRLALYHLTRLLVGTGMWWCWTTAFSSVEHTTGVCSITGHGSKRVCREAGGKWRSFDISGHTFLLIYCNLLLMEEAKAILGWDGIKDAIRREEFNRTEASNAGGSKLDVPGFGADDETYLKDLTDAQLKALKANYSALATWARFCFLLMTLLSLIYDVLFLATVMYFHVMTEKLVAAGLAIAVWAFTYKFWFVQSPFPVGPGVGFAFKCDSKSRGLSPNPTSGRGGLPLKRKSTLTSSPNTGSSQLGGSILNRSDDYSSPLAHTRHFQLVKPEVLSGEVGAY